MFGISRMANKMYDLKPVSQDGVYTTEEIWYSHLVCLVSEENDFCLKKNWHFVAVNLKIALINLSIIMYRWRGMR